MWSASSRVGSRLSTTRISFGTWSRPRLRPGIRWAPTRSGAIQIGPASLDLCGLPLPGLGRAFRLRASVSGLGRGPAFGPASAGHRRARARFPFQANLRQPRFAAVGAGRRAAGHRHRRALGWGGRLLRPWRRNRRHEGHRPGLVAPLALCAADRPRLDAPEHASLADHRHHFYPAGVVRLGGCGPRDLRGGLVPAYERYAAPREGLRLPALALVCGARAAEPALHPAGAISDPNPGIHSDGGQSGRARAGCRRTAAVLGQSVARTDESPRRRRAPLDARPTGCFRDGDGLLLSADIAWRLYMKPFGCLLYF